MPFKVLAYLRSPSATRQSHQSGGASKRALQRLTALRPYLAAGLPLSCATDVKNSAASITAEAFNSIYSCLSTNIILNFSVLTRLGSIKRSVVEIWWGGTACQDIAQWRSGTENKKNGAPGAIPTRDLPLRRRTLYATELREHKTVNRKW